MNVLATGYPIHQSPLYKCNSRARLSGFLGLRATDVEFLVRQRNYLPWHMPQKEAERLAGFPPKKPRRVEEPLAVMKAVHQRLHDLLRRITVPDYLYSAVRGRTYLLNAKRHVGGPRVLRVDVRQFYQSVTKQSVKRFFRSEMGCPPDIAALLGELSCFEGHLPTGSPLSPLLSYLACAGMFREISALAQEADLTFTVYVDDMVFSGDAATRDFASKVLRVLRAHGYRGHKIAVYGVGATKIVTGVAIRGGQLDLPHTRVSKTRRIRKAFDAAKQPDVIRRLGMALVGQYREAERVKPGSAALADQVLATMGKRIGLLGKLKPRRKRVQRTRPTEKQLAQMVGTIRAAIQRKKLKAPQLVDP